MSDITELLQLIIHEESAAIAPQTSNRIEVMRQAQATIADLRAQLEAADVAITACEEYFDNGYELIPMLNGVKRYWQARKSALANPTKPS